MCYIAISKVVKTGPTVIADNIPSSLSKVIADAIMPLQPDRDLERRPFQG